MEAGVWLSLLAVSKSLALYSEHPEWRINDRSDAPVLVQWGNPGFDIVSGYYDVLLASLKELVDMGVRFFKWDAVSTLSSCNAGLEHGQETDSVKEAGVALCIIDNDVMTAGEGIYGGDDSLIAEVEEECIFLLLEIGEHLFQPLVLAGVPRKHP